MPLNPKLIKNKKVKIESGADSAHLRPAGSIKQKSDDVQPAGKVLAGITQESERDPVKGANLLREFNRRQQDRTSAWYDPYRQKTAPKSTEQTKADTVAAQDEWSKLKTHVGFLATRGRGYSAEDIAASIDMTQYPTLARMKQARDEGSALELDEPVRYNDDNLLGAAWAAVNPDTAGADDDANGMMYYTGKGNTLGDAATKADYERNPYKYGSTMDDAMERFGVDSFDDRWLVENSDKADSPDPEEAGAYDSVLQAREFTGRALSESGKAKEEISTRIAAGENPTAVTREVLDRSPALKAMANSIGQGKTLPTTEAVDFDAEQEQADGWKAYRDRRENGPGPVREITAEDASNYAYGHYFEAQAVISEYEKQQAEVARRKDFLVAVPEGDLEGRTVAEEALADAQDALNGLEADYRTARNRMERINALYAVSGGADDDLNSLNMLATAAAQYVPEQFYGYTYFDDQRLDAATTARYKAAYTQEADRLEQLMATADAHGAGMTQEQKQNIRSRIDYDRKMVTDAEYYALRFRDDFEQYAEWGKQESAKDIRKMDDSYVMYANGGELIPTGLTDEELNTYYYLYGSKGVNAAEDYWNYLYSPDDGIVTTRDNQASINRVRDFAASGAAQATVASATSLVSNLFAPIGFGYTVAKTFRGESINPYSSWMGPTNFTSAARGGAMELIGGGFGGALYNAATSAADSLLSALTFGGGMASGASAALGRLADTAVGKAAVDLAGALWMGAGAGASTAVDVAKRGGTPEQQKLMAIGTGLAESMTEAISFENIKSMVHAGEEMAAASMKDFLRQIPGNMVNEISGEVANDIIESSLDSIVMGELSEREQWLSAYRLENPDASDEAVEKAYSAKVAGDLAYTVLTTLLSTAMQGGISYAGGRKAAQWRKSNAEALKPALQQLAGAAESNNDSARAAAVSGALAKLGADEHLAGIAAERLTPERVSGLLTEASQYGVGAADAAEAIGLYTANTAEITGEETFDTVLEAAANADPEKTARVVHAHRVAVAQEAIMAQDATLQQAQTEAQAAQAAADQANAALSAVQQSLTEAKAQANDAISRMNANPQDKAAVKRARAWAARVKGLQSEVDTATATAEAANQTASEASENLLAVQEQVKQTAYRQAAQEVQKQEAAESDAMDLTRAEDNELNAAVDNFLSQNKALQSATDDQRAEIKRIFSEMRETIGSGELNRRAKANTQFLQNVSNRFGVKIVIDPGMEGNARGRYDSSTGELHINGKNITQGEVIKATVLHELTHRAEGSQIYGDLSDLLLKNRFGDDTAALNAEIAARQALYKKRLGQELTEENAKKEVVADELAALISADEETLNRLCGEKPGLMRQVWQWMKDTLQKLTGINDPQVDTLKKAARMMEKALGEVGKAEKSGGAFDNRANQIDDAGSVVASQYSVATWDKTDKDTLKAELLKRVDDNGRTLYSEEQVNKWISDLDSVASRIMAQNANLLYTPNAKWDFLKPNAEYTYTLDASTLCPKRALYQGTYDYIKRLHRSANLTPDDLVTLRRLLKDNGYTAPCGACYVESRRKNLDTYAQAFLLKWKSEHPDAYQPNQYEITTAEGSSELDSEHPEVFDAWLKFANSKGSNNPKAVQTRTEYDSSTGIMKLKDSVIQNLIASGGLRISSFSDFEMPHMIDLMQAVMDMSARGLTAQAYTKIPAFARIFGKTGVKINLSLFAKGLDAKGNIIFDNVEGMNSDEAFKIRDDNSENVGTILVANNEAVLKASLADPRIDFVIPFHRSGWSMKKLAEISDMSNYRDFTSYQNERRVNVGADGKITFGTQWKVKTIPNKKSKIQNIAPLSYWDFEKTGKENAETYLELCYQDHRVPKFCNLLTVDGPETDTPGHFRLQKDGSTDGYWKTLIDFKMYDNDGKGSPQVPVTPTFEAKTYEAEMDAVAKDYNADELPVAKDVAEKFIALKGWDKKKGKAGSQYSLSPEDDFGGFAELVGDGTHEFSERELSDIMNPNGISASRYAGGQMSFEGGTLYAAQAKTDEQQRFEEEFARAEAYQERYQNDPEFQKAWEAYSEGDDFRIELYELLAFYENYEREHQHQTADDQNATLPTGSTLTELARDWYTEATAGDAGDGGGDNNAGTSVPGDGFEVVGGPLTEQTGTRQFAAEGLQDSVMPDWLKNKILTDYGAYAKDSNTEQVQRGYGNVVANGYDAEVNRLLSTERFTATDTAEAVVLMGIADHMGDARTLLSLATKYTVEGTVAGQELQSRKLWNKMLSPAKSRSYTAGQKEQERKQYEQKHKGQAKRANEAAQTVAEEIDKLNAASVEEQVFNGETAEILPQQERELTYGQTVNEQQRYLINHYGLQNVSRPGIYYNRATIKQRMLEAILATPNALEDTGGGMNLLQRLEYIKRGMPCVTQADLNYIGMRTEEYLIGTGRWVRNEDDTIQPMIDEQGNALAGANIEETRAGDVAIARAYEAFANISPTSLSERFRSYRYVNMLLNFTSAERNVLSNAAHMVLNDLSHDISAVIDKLMSVKTGERTRTVLTPAERVASWRAFAEETRNTVADYFIDRVDTAPQQAKYDTKRKARTFQSSFLEASANMESFLMSFGDRNTYRRAFVRSLMEQNRLEEQGLLTLDNEHTDLEQQKLDQAEQDARYSTYTEDNMVSDALTRLKRAIGLPAEVLLPFTGVPTNIAKRIYTYSPAGLLGSLTRFGYDAARGNTVDQRSFVDKVGRGLTGTGVFALGAALFKDGLIRLGTGGEEDKKKKAIEAAAGHRYSAEIYDPNSDSWVELGTLYPAASGLVAGAMFAEELSKADDTESNLLNAAWNGLLACSDELMDNSFVSGLKDAFGGTSDSVSENISNAMLSSFAGQLTPAWLNHIRNVTDPYIRDTSAKGAIDKIWNTIRNRVPGLSETLPEKVNIAGETPTTKGWMSFIDPFSSTPASHNEALMAVSELTDRIGTDEGTPSDELSGTKNSFKVDGITYELDGQQKETFRRTYGLMWTKGGTYTDRYDTQQTVKGVQGYIDDGTWHTMTDEERSAAVKEATTGAKAAARDEAMQTCGYSAEEEAKSLSNLSIDGKLYEKAVAVWKQSEKHSATLLPQVNLSFTEGGTKYEVPEGMREEYLRVAGETYQERLNEAGTVDEKTLKNARDNASKAAKAWYLKNIGK